MSEEEKPRRSLFIFFAIILIVLALSIIVLSQALTAYLSGDFGFETSILLMMGLAGFIATAYMLFQTRRGMLKLTFEAPRVSTTIMCNKCGFKNVRDFQRGDYIFKEAESCPRCNEKMLIASIYREVKEEKKI